MWRQDDELQQMLRESAEGFVASQHSLQRFRQCRESQLGFDLAIWREMADLGWTGILLSEQDGGSGLGLTPALTLAEIFGQYLIPEPFVASAIMAATILSASEATKARELAKDLATGNSIMSVATQEKLSEIRINKPTTAINIVDGKMTLSGCKIFVPAWTEQSILLVHALYEEKDVVVALPMTTQGISSVSRKMGDGSFTADIDFVDVKISAADILLQGDKARAALEMSLARGTLAVSAQLEALARTLLKLTIDYVNQRTQFNQPLGNFQALRHKMVELHIMVEMAGASWQRALKLLDQGGLDEMTQQRIDQAKARCSDAAFEVAKSAIQYHGAFGYTEEADIGLFVNASLRWSSWLGNAAERRMAALQLHNKRGFNNA